MKKIFLTMGILLMGLFTSYTFVSAEEAFYTNNNGLKFTEYQYKSMCDILGEENVANLSSEEYNALSIAYKTEDNTTYETYEVADSDIMPLTVSYETDYKKLSLSTTCLTNYCQIETYVRWKTNPKVRSHDVIGVRFSGTTFYNSTVSTYLKIDNTVTNAVGQYKESNGIGTVVKLTSGDVQYAFQTVNVKPQGTVFGSYQHAVKSISVTNALKFDFSSAGYGGVFAWKSPYNNYYDAMSGLHILAKG